MGAPLPPRKRGRPPGAKNKPKPKRSAVLEALAVPSPAGGTTRATLEADRDRILAGIEALKNEDLVDWKTIASLQSQLNGINRMLLRITGETAPTDANLIRSPQYARLKADLIGALKPFPAALAAVVKVFNTSE